MKLKVRQVLFSLLLLSLLAIAVQAEPYETIINNGSSANRLDIAVLGDGYTAAELQKYKNDVQSFMQGFFLQEPFHEYQPYFNVHRVDVASNQTGADHPERSVFVDTAFDGAYNCSGIQRLICVNASKVSIVLNNTLSAAQRDIVLVIVNDSEYGGSGGVFAVASTNAAAVELILHEEGHGFGLLTDEYGGPPPPNCQNTFEPSAANATMQTQRSLIKWGAWIDPSTPIPTTSSNPGIPGLYQGAQYCDTGLYRPTFNSKMRSLGVPFEQINVEQLVRRNYNFVSPIDAKSPTASSLTLTRGQTQPFSITRLTPLTHTLSVVWTLDGQQQALGPSFDLDTTNLSLGNHTVVATVHDGTAFVRSDPNQVLTATATWTITVNAAATIQLSNTSYSVDEANAQAVVTVTRTGDISTAATVDYATSDTAGVNCDVVNGSASSRCDYIRTLGTLRFDPNESSKTILISIVDDTYAEGNETFTITLSNATVATLGTPTTAQITINDNDGITGPANPIDAAGFFVRQHYIDFLNREPDSSGLAFWTGEITNCGSNTQCIEIKRINVSAAFFVSIEFQQTGYLVYRLYQTAYGTLPGTPIPIRLDEFLPDTQEISRGLVVGAPGWEQQLENNKQTFINRFAQTFRFTVNANYPASLTPTEVVDRMNGRAGAVLSPTERSQLIADLASGTKTRAQVLRAIAEDSDLVNAERNRAFVLMQYFGYLRRNPFDPPEQTLDFQGYNFWLGKLNQFNGNYVQAELVKAFITSIEYRKRFGP